MYIPNIQGPAEVRPACVVGRVRACLARDGQRFEHFTWNVMWCGGVLECDMLCYRTTECDIVMLWFCNKKGVLFVPDLVHGSLISLNKRIILS